MLPLCYQQWLILEQTGAVGLVVLLVVLCCYDWIKLSIGAVGLELSTVSLLVS